MPYEPDNIGAGLRNTRTSLTTHLDAVKREQDRDAGRRRNDDGIVRQRHEGVGNVRSNFADAFEGEWSAQKIDAADEAVLDARDTLRRLRKADAPRQEIEEAREEWQAARARRRELRGA